MANRYQDWFRQAESDLNHCENSRKMGDYDWACFAAHQAAEKAVKALMEFLGEKHRQHFISELLEVLAQKIPIPDSLKHGAFILDGFYLSSRYPQVFDSGAPVDHLTAEDARIGYATARKMVEFCQNQLVATGS
ncbi:MAG: HEPN domain-containing protein [Calditrichaeota bacterium]|nr:MAG: HEPN domain-containing protein [Calditrichota bacterium]